MKALTKEQPLDDKGLCYRRRTVEKREIVSHHKFHRLILLLRLLFLSYNTWL